MPKHSKQDANSKQNSFTERVREVVRSIPAGTTLSYQEVAARAGSPGASRAVGTIMANNYDPTVPCHRVIRADGSLGAYNRGGTTEKRRKLKKEGAL